MKTQDLLGIIILSLSVLAGTVSALDPVLCGPGTYPTAYMDPEAHCDLCPADTYQPFWIYAERDIPGISQCLPCPWAPSGSSVCQGSLCITGYKLDQETGTGIPFWTIRLINDTHNFVTLTDDDGMYQFCSLKPGSYTVTETNLPGWEQVFPSGPYTILLTNTGVANLNFTNHLAFPESISGLVFHDYNANGVNDGDVGDPDWMIYVDYNNNGIWEWEEEPYATTDENGMYTITGIYPGSWNVREIPQSYMHCSYPASSDVHGCYHAVTVPPGGALDSIDFGNWRGAALNGKVVNDLNANHQIDPGELDQGIPAWRVYVDYNGNGFSDNDEPYTNSNIIGEFYLTDLKPGSFSLRVISQEFWECSYPSDCAWNLTLGSGETGLNNYFAYHRPFITVCGYIYEDPDCDGAVELGPGMGLVPVDLWSTKTACVQYNESNPSECLLTAPVKDAVIASTSTEPGSGHYCFYNTVIQGNRYFLAENESLFSGSGWTQSYPAEPDANMGPGYSLFLINPGGQSNGWYFFNYRVIPLPGSSGPPADPDSDGLQEDLNANGFADWDDAVSLFWNTDWIQENEPVACFDLNRNTFIDWDDAVVLFWEV